MLRLRQSGGSSSEYCFIDDVEISYEATWTPEFKLGDVNDDGFVDIEDATMLINLLLYGGDYLPAADLNEDGKMDIEDATALINVLLYGWQ